MRTLANTSTRRARIARGGSHSDGTYGIGPQVNVCKMRDCGCVSGHVLSDAVSEVLRAAVETRYPYMGAPHCESRIIMVRERWAELRPEKKEGHSWTGDEVGWMRWLDVMLPFAELQRFWRISPASRILGWASLSVSRSVAGGWWMVVRRGLLSAPSAASPPPRSPRILAQRRRSPS